MLRDDMREIIPGEASVKECKPLPMIDFHRACRKDAEARHRAASSRKNQSPMATRTLAGLSAILSAARTIPDALRALTEDVLELDRSALLALYDCDQRQGVLCK